MFATFIAATMASLMFMNTLTSNRVSRTNQNEVEAQYLAEGALEAAKKEILDAIANWNVPPADGQLSIYGSAVSFTTTPTGLSLVSVDPAGIQTLVFGYEIEAVAEVGRVQARAHRLIQAEATPIFQFAVFYTNDLEVLPGPSMTLGGRVHSNADIYWGCGNGSTLTVDTNYVRAVGRMYRARKDDPGESTGRVDIRRWVANPYDPSEPEEYVPMFGRNEMEDLGVTTESGYDSNFEDGYDAELDGDLYGDDDFLPWTLGALDYWHEPDGYGGSGYTVRSGEHGVTQAVTPRIGSISMYEDVEAGGDYVWSADDGKYLPVAAGTGTHNRGFFHSRAGLCVIGLGDGTWEAYDADGNDVTGDLASAGAVRLREVHDVRQGGDVEVIEVDIEQLSASGRFPDNGLLYAASYGIGEGTDLKGVKVVNGAEVASALTIVTEGAAYVEGDFNVDGKKGCAVIADALNLLSNAWDDSKSSGSGLPKATETTYNLAFITGNHESAEGHYNGGLENLPRFHESWSGVDCNIHGSFVNAWESQYATSTWVYGGNRYQAPRRNWFYDPAFNQVANLPPFTPMAVTAKDVVSW